MHKVSGFVHDMFRVERAIDGPDPRLIQQNADNELVNFLQRQRCNMNVQQISNVYAPSSANNAANKQYVDNHELQVIMVTN